MCNTFPSIESIQIEINEPIKSNLILFITLRARTPTKIVIVSMEICSMREKNNKLGNSNQWFKITLVFVPSRFVLYVRNGWKPLNIWYFGISPKTAVHKMNDGNAKMTTTLKWQIYDAISIDF